MNLGRLNQKDVGAGALCAAVAIVGLLQNGHNALNTSAGIGPGFFPAIVFSLLGTFGAALVAWRLVRPGEKFGPWAFRPLLAITAAVLVFALMVERSGFIIAAVLMLIVGCLAHGRLRVLHIGLLAVVGAAASAVLFVGLLHLPLPIWPRF